MIQACRTVYVLNLDNHVQKTNPGGPRRHYDRTGGPDQFKTDAVRLVENGQRSVPDVAKSLGISTNLLYRWLRLAKARWPIRLN